MIYTVPGVVDKVIDGDTIYCWCDLGWDLKVYVRVRALGINAPELSTPAGKDAKAFAETLLPAGTAVEVESHGWDKYGGRTDAFIRLPNGDEFGVRMILAGEAVPWDGKGAKP